LKIGIQKINLTISSNDNFYSGFIIKGFTSKTQGNITSIERIDSFFETGATSKVERGWQQLMQDF
jgi:hypothetical protein